MNFFERVPPADFPDKVLGEQERNFTDPPVPFSEKEYFKTGNFHARAGEPTPGVSAKPAPPSKKTSLFSGKGIIICAMLSLATGIAVGASWSRTHIFADSSKGQPAVQAAPAAAVVTTPNFNEIQNQLNAIARDLSSVQQNVKELAAGQEHVQQNINELAAGQEQMRKAQGQLAALQARLVNLQTLANANQNKQPAPAATERRKFYRGDYR